MLTCVPTRFLASTGGHPANATPSLESAKHNLDTRRSPLIRTTDAPLNGSTQITDITFRAQSAAAAHHELLSIPILLPH
jgi:hypothetical protein